MNIFSPLSVTEFVFQNPLPLEGQSALSSKPAVTGRETSSFIVKMNKENEC